MSDKENWMATGKFMEMCQLEGKNLFAYIVIGENTWKHHTAPEIKQQSKVWFFN